MFLAIPRGIIYHRLTDDLKWLIFSLFAKLDDPCKIRDFESTFSRTLGRKHCIAFPLARTAIYFSLKAQSFPLGSEIIMPPITIKGIFDVVLELKLKPVFVDINPETLSFDEDALKSAVTNNTRAIIITYLFGMVPNVENMVRLCKENNIFVIEDFSQCLNGRYGGKKTGTFGDVGVYSASSIKTLDTFGGGIAVCDDDILSAKLRASFTTLAPPNRKILFGKIVTNVIRNVATNRLIFNFLTLPAIKLMNILRPNSVMKQTGERSDAMILSLPAEWFCSYSSFQAAIGLELLERLTMIDTARIANAEKIKQRVKAIRFPKGVPNGENVYWQLLAYLDEPLSFQRKLHKLNVDTASTSLMKISNLPAYPVQGHTPNADRLYTSSLFIPAHHNLSEGDIEYVISAVKSIYASRPGESV